MKTVLIVIGVVLVVGATIADYKWKQWMEARKEERQGPGNRD